MPLPENPASPSPPARLMRPRRWLWAPLLLALAAPATLAQPTPPPAPDFAKEAELAESSGRVLHVAPEHQTHLTVRGAERVRVDAPDVAQVSLGEPDQVMVQGLRQGRAELLVWRKGARPLRLRVEVAK